MQKSRVTGIHAESASNKHILANRIPQLQSPQAIQHQKSSGGEK